MLCYFNKVYVVVHQVQFKVHRIKCNLANLGFLQWSLLLIVRSDTKGRSYTDGIVEMMIMSFER